MSSNTCSVTVSVNGETCNLQVDPWVTLLEVLRDELGLTGTKKCCGEGECGACTVLLDGRAVNSCLVLAAEVDGSEVLTVESLASAPKGPELQAAFLDHGAVQCGFCTPGMLMSAHYLLMNNPSPSIEEIKDGLAGNLCRCTGYSRIIDAVTSVSEAKK